MEADELPAHRRPRRKRPDRAHGTVQGGTRHETRGAAAQTTGRRLPKRRQRDARPRRRGQGLREPRRDLRRLPTSFWSLPRADHLLTGRREWSRCALPREATAEQRSRWAIIIVVPEGGIDE